MREAVELPPGTALSVRLTTAIPRQARPGLPVQAVLVAAVDRDGAVLLRAGGTLHGTVKASGRLPRERHRSYLDLEFGDIVTPAGAVLPLRARVADVDNARESVDSEGRIIGLPWIPVRPTTVEALLLLAAHAHPVALVAFEAGKLAVRQAARVPVEYAAGTDMTLTLREPLRVRAPPPETPRPDLSENAVLAALAARLPARTEATRSRRPSDLTNILLVGTREEVAEAFVAAGWTEARPFGLKAAARSFVALAERHGYKPAPVSRQELGGAAPAAVFEKQNNTLAKRHHVRIWAVDEAFRGRPVWLGAATHDVGIVFDHKDRTFTHRIDARIDDERQKVMADVEFVGRVREAGLLERLHVPRRTQTATGDPVESDGRLGVLILEEAPPLTP